MTEQTTYHLMVYNEAGDCVTDQPLVIYSRGDVITGGRVGDVMLPKSVLRAIFHGADITDGPLADLPSTEAQAAPSHTSAHQPG